jgi:hypothetical protein
MPKNSKQYKSSKNAAKKASTPKESPNPKGWEYAAFTKKSVGFNSAAKVLSASLKTEYGDNVSISQFEKLISSLQSMTKEEQSLIYISQTSVNLLKSYRAARASRDSERDNFRGDTAIGNVDTGLEALGELNIIENKDFSPYSQFTLPQNEVEENTED